MKLGKSRKHSFACFFNVYFNLAAVGLASLTAHQTECFAARHQRDDAMMLSLKPLREFADSCPVALRISLDMQQQQILQGVMPSLCAACSENRSKRRI